MTVVLCALLGLVIGSFLNVVVARVPAGESVVRPGSRCPHCGTPIAPRDNVPVLGWLLLRGRARCCGAPISRRYPLVELATAAAFAGVAAWCGLRPELAAFLYLAAISIALALIDLDTFRLPFVIVAPSYAVAAALLGAAALAGAGTGPLLRAAIGGATLWLLYRVLHAVHAKGMGYGDVRLAGLLGLHLGWVGWPALAVGAFLGFLTGGVWGLALTAARRASLKSHLPFGPFMLLGAWLGILVGAPIAGWYLRGAGLID